MHIKYSQTTAQNPSVYSRIRLAKTNNCRCKR